MTPINNSDTAWLIVSDYNQENNLPYEELREDVLTSDSHQWHHEYLGIIMDVVKVWGNVGSVWNYGVGDNNDNVGVRGVAIGGDRLALEHCSMCVGGHESDQ
jgi:hypothetical protein